MDLSAKIGIGAATLLVLGGSLLGGEDSQEFQQVDLPPPVLNEVIASEKVEDSDVPPEQPASIEVDAEIMSEVLLENAVQSEEKFVEPIPQTDKQVQRKIDQSVQTAELVASEEVQSSQGTEEQSAAQYPLGTWYVSSHHSSKYYYHETCDGWQGLSPKHLRSFETEAALKASVPGRVLHYECIPN